MEQIESFIPPEQVEAGIVGRFLAPLPWNVVEAYIRAYTAENGVVVDPFCRTDVVARRAARLGRRAVLADFNPLVAFIVRTSLTPLPLRELEAAFERLQTSLKLGVPLKEHLLKLYTTTCPHCGQLAIADYFVWSRQLDQPIKKHYHCHTCHEDRLEPTDDADRQALAGIEAKGFHYWAILERLSPPSEEGRALAQRLLDLYTPRNLYALATLATKIEAAIESPTAQAALKLALLPALDEGSKLRRLPDKPVSRLHPPAQFMEVNVWQAFEAAYQMMRRQMEQDAPDTPRLRLASTLEQVVERELTLWSASRGPRSAPNVLVQRASARRLGDALPAESVDLILSAPPRLDQGDFLALSYLWTGWLLGKEEAATFRLDYLLHPRRPNDWEWLAQALQPSLRALARSLGPSGRLVFTFTSYDLPYVEAVLLAAAATGLLLESVIYQPRYIQDHLMYRGQPLPTADLASATAFGGLAGQYTLRFGKGLEPHRAKEGPHPPPTPSLSRRLTTVDGGGQELDPLAADTQAAALRAAKDILVQRAEPLSFNWLHNAIWWRLAQAGLLAQVTMQAVEETPPLAFLRQQVEEGLNKGLQRDLVQLEVESPKAAAPSPQPPQPTGTDEQPPSSPPPTTSDEQPATGRVVWWLAKPSFATPPLSDRVEQAVYNVLSTASVTTQAAIERVVYSLFPGLLTPEPGLIEACLSSYGRLLSPPGRDTSRHVAQWQLREEEQLQWRSREHTGMIGLLVELGHRLGLRVWVSRSEQKRAIARAGSLPTKARGPSGQPPEGTLGDLLTVEERYVNPTLLFKDGERAPLIDVIWYDRGRAVCLFEVEWTAQLAEPLLSRAVSGDGVKRYVVLPLERTELARFKLARSPLLRQVIAAQGWDFLKYTHLREFSRREEINLAALEPLVGLTPPVEQFGVQLSLF